MTADAQPATTSKLKKFLRVPTRTQLLGASGASLLFLIGWFAEEGLTWAKATYWPDDYQARAEAVREELSAKSDAIRDLTNRMAEDLAGLKAGSADGAALEDFLAKAEQLMQRTEELRPVVASAADFSGEMAEVYASAKASEIARLGYSTKADFTLVNNQGASICAERFSFGVSTWYNDDDVTAKLSYRDDEEYASVFKPGDSMSVESPSTKATVTYIGPVGQGDDRQLGFNVECDPLLTGNAA